MDLEIRLIICSLLIAAISCNSSSIKIQNIPGFEILKIDKSLKDEMVAKNVFGEHSPIPIERLNLVKLRYVDFNGEEQSGQVIVMDACAMQVKQIFIELYQARFPLAQVTLISEYNGSDSLSMAQNNTSAHNLRAVTGGKRLSLHAYGTAIDINPVNNPYIDIPCNDKMGIAKFEPIAGIKFANRMQNRIGKKKREGMAEDAIDIFARNGFYWWGGYWNCPIDYQHFQISRSVTELLVEMNPKEAKAFVTTMQDYFNANDEPIEYALRKAFGDDVSLKDAYKEDAAEFNKKLIELF